MTMWFYVKTTDTPKAVGDIVCAFNYTTGEHPGDKYTWNMEKGEGEEEFWQIMSKYEGMKELAVVAVAYKAGDTVVLGEIRDEFVPNFLDPLLEKYGFDNIKWIVSRSNR